MYNVSVCLKKKTKPPGRQPRQGDTMKEKNTDFRAERALETEEDSWNQDFSTKFAQDDEDAGSWWMDEK